MGKPLLKKQADSGPSQQGHKKMGELLNFQQQAKWPSCHESADVAGELTLRAASPTVLADKDDRHCGQANPVHSKPSSLGQQGRETSRSSYKRLTASPSGRGQQGSKTLQARGAVLQKGR